ALESGREDVVWPEAVVDGPALALWRAPVDNDWIHAGVTRSTPADRWRLWGLHRDGACPEGVEHRQTRHALEGGGVLVEEEVVVGDDYDDLARVGSVLTIAAGPIPVLITVFAVAKLLLTGRPPFSWQTAALGAAAGLVDGVARAIMPLRGVIEDPRWLLAATLVAHLLLMVSARVQHRQLAASPSSIRESGRHQSYSALPYCAIAVTCALLGIAIATGGNGPRTWALFGLTILSVLFVVFRQLSALAGNAHQLAELDLRLRELTRVVAAGEGFHPAPADRLTGLASRAEFAVRLQEAWDGACETRSRIGIMLVDLDRFTALTSQVGDRTGDVILQQASTRLADCLRTGDLAARLGADRFAVLLSGPTLGHLQHVARRVVAALAEPYAIGTEPVRITASVGIAVERGDRTDPGRLLRDADEAVYAAKSRYSTRSGGAEIYA
ncbi:MAG: hypothetical protein QOI35_2952, partial [Cryptosporangiaceae bacterium]|nr:hypothetical protein [Cryptosporangiaceae bacterium]